MTFENQNDCVAVGIKHYVAQFNSYKKHKQAGQGGGGGGGGGGRKNITAHTNGIIVN